MTPFRVTRLSALRAEFAGHCAKAERKIAEQDRAARRVSESTGHNTRPLKLKSARIHRAPLTDLSTPTTNTHEN